MTIGEAGNRSKKSGKTRAKWYRNDGHHSRNIDGQESKETMKNCGQEDVQAEFGVDKLLTMNENKNGTQDTDTAGDLLACTYTILLRYA
jgi:hypothetical protein